MPIDTKNENEYIMNQHEIDIEERMQTNGRVASRREREWKSQRSQDRVHTFEKYIHLLEAEANKEKQMWSRAGIDAV